MSSLPIQRSSTCSSRIIELPSRQIPAWEFSLETDCNSVTRDRLQRCDHIYQLIPSYSLYPPEQHSPVTQVSCVTKRSVKTVKITSFIIFLPLLCFGIKILETINSRIALLFPPCKFHCEWTGQLARQSLSWFWWVSGSLSLSTYLHTSPQYWRSFHQALMDPSKEEILNRNSISKKLLT